MSEWQPIETAPKDAACLLLWWPDMKRPVFGFWYSEKYHNKPQPHWTSRDVMFGVKWLRNNPPTHWMELPSPPAD